MLRSGLFASSATLGASTSTAVTTKERVLAGTPDQARWGLLLGPGTGPSLPGIPSALTAGTGCPATSDLLTSFMVSPCCRTGSRLRLAAQGRSAVNRARALHP